MTGSVPSSQVDHPQDGAVTHEMFRRVMASFVTGVTVITTQVRGEVRGMTANAFMSGSLEPPLCVVSVGLTARMHAFLLEAGHFGVNILARGQEQLIGHFSGRPVENMNVNYEYIGDTPHRRHAAAGRRSRDDCREGDRPPSLRRPLAVRRPHPGAAAPRRRHPDRPPCRPVGLAQIPAGAGAGSDPGFLVIGCSTAPYRASRDS
jgi:hypothetical protein